jgi:endoribonuclease Dicer
VLTPSLTVVIHGVILSSATDSTVAIAARRASLFALDALEGDAEFLTKTCDCRSHVQSKKGQKGVEAALAGLQDEILAVEKPLIQGNDEVEKGSPMLDDVKDATKE